MSQNETISFIQILPYFNKKKENKEKNKEFCKYFKKVLKKEHSIIDFYQKDTDLKLF